MIFLFIHEDVSFPESSPVTVSFCECPKNSITSSLSVRRYLRLARYSARARRADDQRNQFTSVARFTFFLCRSIASSLNYNKLAVRRRVLVRFPLTCCCCQSLRKRLIREGTQVLVGPDCLLSKASHPPISNEHARVCKRVQKEERRWHPKLLSQEQHPSADPPLRRNARSKKR